MKRFTATERPFKHFLPTAMFVRHFLDDVEDETPWLWPEGKMPGNGVKEAEVPQNDGFHRITDISRSTLTLGPFLRVAGGAGEI